MTATAQTERATMTAEKFREESHRILTGYFEGRGWDVLEPHGWRESDCVAYDPEDGALVLISIEAEFQDEDNGSLPSLNVDDADLERAKARVHAYIGEHPDASCVRYDFISMTIFGGRQGRIRHLVSAYLWEE